jgi:hypothetical protein
VIEMPATMTAAVAVTPTVTARARALFASTLRPCDHLDPALVREAIDGTLAALGATGCLCAVAQEYGDHPESAARRMRWALSVVAGH